MIEYYTLKFCPKKIIEMKISHYLNFLVELSVKISRFKRDLSYVNQKVDFEVHLVEISCTASVLSEFVMETLYNAVNVVCN